MFSRASRFAAFSAARVGKGVIRFRGFEREERGEERHVGSARTIRPKKRGRGEEMEEPPRELEASFSRAVEEEGRGRIDYEVVR